MPGRTRPFFSPTEAGHGRVVTRGVHAFALEPLAAGFPCARALIRGRTRRVQRTAATAAEVRYRLTGAEPAAHPPDAMAGTHPRPLGRR